MQIMVKGIAFGEELIAGMVPALTNKEFFRTAHETARKTDALLHVTHSAMLAMATERTQYDDAKIRAINIGAMAYETLAAVAVEPIPADFMVDALASRTVQPNYDLLFSEELQRQHDALVANHPRLAEGLCRVCVSQLGPNSSHDAEIYGLGGAGLMMHAHNEINDMWDVKRLLDSVDFS